MNTNSILGTFSVLIALIGYVPYYRDVLNGSTKPHTFSWLVWCLTSAVSFAGQVSDNAGPGAWVMGTITLVSFGVFILSLKKGEKNIARVDYVCLGISLIAIASWILTNTPLYAIILVTIADVFGFIPTIRKSYQKPYEESLMVYLTSIFQFVISLFALENVSVITALNPFILAFVNVGFVFILITRRRVILKPKGY